MAASPLVHPRHCGARSEGWLREGRQMGFSQSGHGQVTCRTGNGLEGDGKGWADTRSRISAVPASPSHCPLSNLLSPKLPWPLISSYRLQIIPSALFFFTLFSRAFSGTTFTPIQPYVALPNMKDEVSPLHPFGVSFSCIQRHTGPFAWGYVLAAPLCNTLLFPVHGI